MAAGVINCGTFAQYLIRKAEHLDMELLRTVLPTDGLVNMVETGPFPAYDGVSHEYDRLERTVPDLIGAWDRVVSSGCVGTPCDPSETKIGFGSTRHSYFLEQRSFGTDLFCFDLIMTADRAKEQFAQLIDILKEATIMIGSDWIRRSLINVAGRKWVASASMAEITYTWNADNSEITVSALPTSKLTAPMLERRVQPQISLGAMGNRPQGTPMLLELVTDMDTLYSLEQGNAATNQFWRFTSFDDSNKKFYELGWAGKIGNYAVRVDLFPARFMVKEGGGGLVLTRVFPFITVAATLGVKSIPNPDYDRAPYQFTLIHSRKSMKHLTLSSEAVNPQMPFLKRDFAGKWMFVQNNIAGENGCAIDNSRMNKGKFIADYKFSAKPWHTEWEESILHLREPFCVTTVGLCDTSLTSSYPTGSYDSANALCTRVFVFTPTLNGSNIYQVLADTITCNGQAIDHAAITTPTTLALLVTALNTVASSMGVWALVDGSTTTIQLTGNGCTSANVPFVPA